MGHMRVTWGFSTNAPRGFGPFELSRSAATKRAHRWRTTPESLRVNVVARHGERPASA